MKVTVKETKQHKLKNILIKLDYILYAKKEKNNGEKREEEVIILMIPSGEKLWHYLAVKKTISIIKRNDF